jgi:hypothetical protein
MANSSTNVVVAAPITGGGALVAPIGTTLPTAIATALDADFEALGYLSDDGVNETTDRSSKKQYAWGGDTIATTQDSYGKSFKLTIAEYLNATAKSVVKGASNVTVTAATSTTGTRITSKDTSAQLPLNSWVFDIVSGTARIPEGDPLRPDLRPRRHRLQVDRHLRSGDHHRRVPRRDRCLHVRVHRRRDLHRLTLEPGWVLVPADSSTHPACPPPARRFS